MGIALLLLGLLAGTLGLSHGLQSQMARHLTDKLLSSQKLRIQEKVDRFDLTLRNAERSVKRYAALISSDRDPTPPSSDRFEQVFPRDADGSWRLPRQRFNPQEDANAWIPPEVPLTETNKRF